MNSSTFHTPSVSSFGLHHKQLTTTSKQATFGFSHIDYDVETIMSSLTSQNEDRREAIYQFITNLKADLGIVKLTDAFDCFYMFAAPTEADSLVNWAQPGTYNCTKTGSIVFVSNRGWRNGIAGSYLNSNFNPYGLDNINFGPGSTSSSVNNIKASWGIYVNSSSNGFLGGDWPIMGAYRGAVGSPIIFIARNSASFVSYGCYSGGIPGSGVNQFSSPIKAFGEGGLFSCVKPDFGSTELYFNGDLIDRRIGTIGQTALQDSGTIIFGNSNFNTSGSTVSITGSPDFKMFSFSYIGSSRIKPDIINRRLNEYLYAVNGQSYITSTRAS